MKFKWFSLFTVSLSLLACANKPEIKLTEDPIIIDSKQVKLDKYWIRESQSFTFNLKDRFTPKKGTQGYVKIRYLIDSNGNVFNPEIIESKPEGILDGAGLQALSNFKYVKSAQNPKAVPVFMTTTIEFKF